MIPCHFALTFRFHEPATLNLSFVFSRKLASARRSLGWANKNLFALRQFAPFIFTGRRWTHRTSCQSVSAVSHCVPPEKSSTRLLSFNQYNLLCSTPVKTPSQVTVDGCLKRAASALPSYSNGTAAKAAGVVETGQSNLWTQSASNHLPSGSGSNLSSSTPGGGTYRRGRLIFTPDTPASEKRGAACFQAVLL